MAEVDHLGALGLEDPPHDVDRRVVAVEQAGGGDEPDGVSSGGVGRAAISEDYSDLLPSVILPSVALAGTIGAVPSPTRRLPFDPIAEARRHWDDRWAGGAPMAAATSIMRAQQIVLARVDEALRPFDLTFARYEALVLLTFSRSGSLPLGKMGERLMIHPTSVTNIVDRLEAQGLVRRARPPHRPPHHPLRDHRRGPQGRRGRHRRRRRHRSRHRRPHRSRVRPAARASSPRCGGPAATSPDVGSRPSRSRGPAAEGRS